MDDKLGSPEKPSRRDQFLANVPLMKPNPHLEEELYYEDKDHSIAHGHHAQSGLVKLRTISTVT